MFLKYIWLLVALTDRKKFKTSEFIDRKPVNALTITGKKVIRAAIRILGAEPKPNQITNKGAIATMGVTLTSKANGNSVLSTKREWTITVAPKMATVAPSKKPPKASIRVMNPW